MFRMEDHNRYDEPVRTMPDPGHRRPSWPYSDPVIPGMGGASSRVDPPSAHEAIDGIEARARTDPSLYMPENYYG